MENGSEVTTNGWPQVTTRKPYYEKGSSSLTIVDAKDYFSYLYATHSAYPDTDDGGDFQGHVTIINLIQVRKLYLMSYAAICPSI